MSIERYGNTMNRQIVRFGATTRQNDVFRPATDRAPNGQAGPLQYAARRPSGRMDGRRIGRAHAPYIQHRLARFRPQRRGRIVICIYHRTGYTHLSAILQV